MAASSVEKQTGGFVEWESFKIKKFKIFISIFMFSISAISAYAQSTVNQKIPEGMEAVRIGGSGWLIVPQGAKTRRVGAQIIVEGSKEYMSRRFFEMDERLQKIEKNQEDLKNEVDALKELVAGMQKNP